MTEQLALPYFTVDLQSCLIIISTVKVKSLRCVRFFAIPQTVNYQAPQSMGFSRQEFWGRLSFPSPGDLPNPGIEPWSPALQADALPSEPPGKLSYNLYNKVTQLYVCVCMSVCVCVLFPILFHDGLSRDIEYISLHCTVGPCCWSILCTIGCVH